MRMWVVLTALLLLGGTPRDAKKDLKEALENTSELRSYFYQKNASAKDDKRTRSAGGAGEFVAPDVVTYRSSIFEAARKGEKTIYKDKNEWKELKSGSRSPYARNIRALQPPHTKVGDFIELIQKPKRDYKVRIKINKLKYTVISGKIAGEDISKAVRALGPDPGISLGNFVTPDFDNSELKVQIVIHPKLKVFHKIRMYGDIKVKSRLGRGGGTREYSRSLEFHTWNETRLGLAPSEKELLGYEEEER